VSFEVNHPRFTQLYIRGQRQLEHMVGPIRKQQNQRAYGKTLIVGAGTGLDIVALDVTTVTKVVLLEPDPSMKAVLREKYAKIPIVASSAEKMNVEDQQFDTVITSLVLCSVFDVDQVLREVVRVLKPGGQYLFMEHVRHSERVQRGVQNTLNPLWKKIAGGCNLNRDIRADLQRSALTVMDYSAAKSNFLIPIVVGRAVRDL